MGVGRTGSAFGVFSPSTSSTRFPSVGAVSGGATKPFDGGGMRSKTQMIQFRLEFGTPNNIYLVLVLFTIPLNVIYSSCTFTSIY